MALTRRAAATGHEPLRRPARSRALARLGGGGRSGRIDVSDQTLLIVAGLALLVVVVLVVTRPLLGPEPEVVDDDEQRAALEAAKEAKYREIRDAELDHRMGKLSDADFRVTDRELRAQAIAILKQLDALDEARAPGDEGGPRAGGAERTGR